MLASLQQLLMLALTLTLMLAILQPISAANLQRQIRSSYLDTEYANTNQDYSGSQLPQQNEPRRNSASPILTRINEIFQTSNETGVTLFQQNHNTNLERIHAGESFFDRTSNQEQTFKVQRGSDGKLNLVFNEVLFFQRHTTEAYSTPRPKSAVVYPEQQQQQQTPRGRCGGKTYCTNVENYPDLSNLNTVLNAQFNEGFTFISEDVAVPDNVTIRINGQPDEEDPCNAKERVIYPEQALSIEQKWLFVVNDNKNFKQGIRVEECPHSENNKEVSCNVGALQIGYRAICKQHYVYRTMWALNSNSTAIINEQFKMPSCCKCVIKLPRS